MSFDETRYLSGIAYGCTSIPMYSTKRVRTFNGKLYRNINWSYPLHRFSISVQNGIETAEFLEAQTLFHALAGSGHGFRFKDPHDYTTAADINTAFAFDDVQIGTGDGVTTDFQILKKYTKGTLTTSRIIQKPVSGQIKSGVAGVEKTITTDWTVDTTTGIISYLVAPTMGQAVTAGCLFDVPVIASDDINEALIDKDISQLSMELQEIRV